MSIITLTTDFGEKDGFAGVMKGVIWGICPEVQIADITHAITPQNILEGAWALFRAVPFFPAGTIHIAVVDPGVGTKRRPMGARLGDHYFVGPDNGLFTPVITEAQDAHRTVEFVQLDKLEFWLPNQSHTFHGRDIFAPVAGHLAKGIPLSKLGTPFSDPVLLELPEPTPTENGWEAHVTIIDVFGNITTDLRASLIETVDNPVFTIKGHSIGGLVDSYGWKNPGELVALIDSEGFIEIAIVNGSAARELGVEIGDIVQVKFG